MIDEDRRMSDVTSSDRHRSLISSTRRGPLRGTALAVLPTPLRRALLLMLVGAGLSTLGALVALTLHDHILAGLADHGRQYPRDRLTPVEMDQAASTTVTVLAASLAVATVLWLVMAWLNLRGRWWARILSTVLCMFCVLQTWSFLTRGYPTVTAGILEVLVLVVAIAATVLLWHPQNASHFASTSSDRATTRS